MNGIVIAGGTESDREQILELHARYIEANAEFDCEALHSIWSSDPNALYFNLNGHTYKGREHWLRLWKYYSANVQSSHWQPFDMGGLIDDGVAVVWCHRKTRRTWTGLEPPPRDVFYDPLEFLSRSTMVFRREADGQWRIVHVHFSRGEDTPRPGGI